MDEAIVQALNNDRLIDITTIGRKTDRTRKLTISAP